MIEKKSACIGYAKRKEARANVFVSVGFGHFTFINKKNNKINAISDKVIDYIKYPAHLLGIDTKINIDIKASGGGIVAQRDASRLALAIALTKLDNNYFSILKLNKFLTYDTRVKERRKYGLKKARKAPQYSKR
jgi:small subunit ribosomal protein S9